MRIWIVLALVLSAALSGCAGEESSTPDATPTTDDSGGQNQTATATSSSTTSAPAPGNETEPQPNTPPTAELTADVVNGTAPLNVTFTLGGEDADGDALDWTLTINGTQAANGTTLPATFTYNFTEAGNFTAVLSVSDGVNMTEASVDVAVAAAVDGGFVPWDASGTAETSCPGCLPPGEGAPVPPACVGLASGTNELDCVFFDLPDGAEGRTATIVGDGLDGDWAEYAFMTACSPDAGVLSTGSGYEGLETTVPAGAACIVMYDSLLPGTTLSISIV